MTPRPDVEAIEHAAYAGHPTRDPEADVRALCIYIAAIEAKRDALRAAVTNVALIRRAVADPGQFLPRGRYPSHEPIHSWAARAVVAALAEAAPIEPDRECNIPGGISTRNVAFQELDKLCEQLLDAPRGTVEHVIGGRLDYALSLARASGGAAPQPTPEDGA